MNEIDALTIRVLTIHIRNIEQAYAAAQEHIRQLEAKLAEAAPEATDD